MIRSVTRYTLIAAATALSALPQSASPSTIIGAGYLFPASINVAPGQIITVFATGVGSTLTQPVFAGGGDLPSLLAGISVTLVQATNIPAPILQVNPLSTCGSCGAMTAITIQIPYQLYQPPPTGGLEPSVALFVTENGVAGNWTILNPVPDQVHILTVCDTVIGGSGSSTGRCQWEVTHANDTLVTTSSPATVGEELVAYAVGLGATNPAVPTGQPAAQPTPTAETFGLAFNSPSFTGVTLARAVSPLFAGLVLGYPGLYQINFIVPPLPSGALPCASAAAPVTANLAVSVIGSMSSDGAAICVSL
jgi:uncharacterized protein (TIGR03437 family)